MSLFHYLKRLYSLDTLDTRFTTSSKTPLQAAASGHGIDRSKPAITSNGQVVEQRGPLPGAQPSKWNTVEFYFYYFVFITIVPLMFYVPYTVSRESDPEYPKFAPLLSKGWILGRKVDNSDSQYASFRDNIPYMAVLVIVHPLLRRAYETFSNSGVKDVKEGPPEAQADARLERRVKYDLVFSAIFLLALHAFSAFKVLLILYINFSLGTKLPKKYIAPATWIFNITIIFTNKIYRGYPYADIAAFFAPISAEAAGHAVVNWGSWLDRVGGLIPRWEILFNLTVLRLISFNMDYRWSLDQRGSSPLEKQLDPSALSERDRVALPAPARAFTFRHYLAYTLYSPLYLAGPIVSFNDFVAQLRYPSPTITRARTTLYAIRFVLTLLTMEGVLHFIYAVAISKSSPDWAHYTPMQLSMLGYFNLHIIWLKLLIPWRFFRLWALVDGVDPPENMVRCMSNNPSALAFWRSWHRSYNRWLVRYIYVPLGGDASSSSGGSSTFAKARSLLNMLAVFTFVAVWHDVSLTLLSWSWLIVLFLFPETICATVLFPPSRWRAHPERYRMICSVGAVGNILMMMAANLVGFAIGVDGLVGLVKGLMSEPGQGVAFLLAACATLFVGVQVMFEVREEEKRKGIALKC